MDGIFLTPKGHKLELPFDANSFKVATRNLCLFANNEGKLAASKCNQLRSFLCEMKPEGENLIKNIVANAINIKVETHDNKAKCER